MKADPKPYEWDFDGACAPDPDGKPNRPWHSATFSLGIFQWVPKASGKGLKRSRVVKRMKASTDPQHARLLYDAAKAMVAKLNEQGANEGDFA